MMRCLDQNGPRSMRHGMQLINFIYQNSLTTIAAAGGSDANAGLGKFRSPVFFEAMDANNQAKLSTGGFEGCKSPSEEVEMICSRAWT